jgi:hypothetical protein
MARRALGILVVTTSLLGCGDSEVATPAEPAAATIEVPGMYFVKGTTVDKTSGASRHISGTLLLKRSGDTYTSSFNLSTQFPSEEGPLAAEVIGTGKGIVDGRELRGTADTQIVLATVSGVDTGFAFVPRTVGPRILSDSLASFADDGTVTMEIENRAAEGQEYRPTHTTLRGTRVGDEADAAEAGLE